MAIFKKKVPLPGLVRTLLSQMVANGRFGTDQPNLDFLNLDELDPTNALSRQERDRLLEEVPTFMVAIQFFEFLDLADRGRIAFRAEDFAEMYAIAITLAFSDAGLPQKQAQATAERYFDVVGDYVDGVEGSEVKGLPEHEICFHACRHFQERVLGDEVRGADLVAKWPTVSSVAHQIHRSIAGATEMVLRDVRPVM